MTYKEGWILVNEVPTRVKTWGGWIEDPLPEGDSLIICVPGNPGMSPFYHTFLAALHQQLGVPVWVTSHAGHELPPPSENLKMPKDLSLCNLDTQVAHKVAFVKQYVPANRKLYFIGHSLGAKIVSDLLRDKQIGDHTKNCYLLMPTLEKIGETPNGKFLTAILTYFMSTIIFFAWIFSLFPSKSREFFINCWFLLNGHHSVDKTSMEATCHLTLPRQLKNIFTLALDEMRQIRDLDMEVLNSHCDKLRVYFAREDGWAPLSYMESLKKAKPELEVSVLPEQFQHAFVLDNPEELADLLVQQIKKDRAAKVGS